MSDSRFGILGDQAVDLSGREDDAAFSQEGAELARLPQVLVWPSARRSFQV